MKNLTKKIKLFIITKLLKEDDENHLLFLYKNNNNINKFLTIGKLSSGIFHDLFTPISSLTLVIDHISKEGVLDNHELRDSLLNSKNELNNFIKIIQEYLKEDIKVENFCVSKLLDQSIRLMKCKINENNIKVTLFRQSNINIRTNKMKLLQVINNIVSNAIDSFENINKIDKAININLYKDKNNITLSISDNGSGISKKIIKKIYNPLFTTRDKGIGLGLSTVRNIVENDLNGKINILSKENIGTKIIIIFPK